MSNVATLRSEISSLRVVEPLPQLMITLSHMDKGAPTILVGGLPAPVAMEIPWGDIIDGLGGLLKRVRDHATSGGGGGCTTIKITHPDGSSTEIKDCPATKTA